MSTRAESRAHRGERRSHRRFVGHVDRDGLGRRCAAERSRPARRAARRRGRAATPSRPSPGERRGDRGADAPAAAGDDGVAAGERAHRAATSSGCGPTRRSGRRTSSSAALNASGCSMLAMCDAEGIGTNSEPGMFSWMVFVEAAEASSVPVIASTGILISFSRVGEVDLRQRMAAAGIAGDRRRTDHVGDQLHPVGLRLEVRRGEPAREGRVDERLHPFRLGDLDALLPHRPDLGRVAAGRVGEDEALQETRAPERERLADHRAHRDADPVRLAHAAPRRVLPPRRRRACRACTVRPARRSGRARGCRSAGP